jgi:hypothetical protein
VSLKRCVGTQANKARGQVRLHQKLQAMMNSTALPRNSEALLTWQTHSISNAAAAAKTLGMGLVECDPLKQGKNRSTKIPQGRH